MTSNHEILTPLEALRELYAEIRPAYEGGNIRTNDYAALVRAIDDVERTIITYSWNQDAIRTARHAHGLTQHRLAQLLECSDSTIESWERGVALPSDPYRRRLTEVFSDEGENQ